MSEALDRLETLLEFKKTHVALAAGCSLDTHPTKHNWVEDQGGLPEYICQIAKDIHEQHGMPVGQAISIAVSRCKVWAAGGGNVNADTRAKAAKAVAEWEAKKARTHAKVAASGADFEDEIELSAAEILMAELAARTVAGPYGKVQYADPKNKKYPIDTEAHVRAAWAYINKPANAAKYPLNGVSLESVKSAIQNAAKKLGIDVDSDNDSGKDTDKDND